MFFYNYSINSIDSSYKKNNAFARCWLGFLFVCLSGFFVKNMPAGAAHLFDPAFFFQFFQIAGGGGVRYSQQLLNLIISELSPRLKISQDFLFVSRFRSRLPLDQYRLLPQYYFLPVFTSSSPRSKHNKRSRYQADKKNQQPLHIK